MKQLPHELLFLRRKVLPIIHQAEAAECGLACLTMIAKYFGHDVDLNGLRQRFALSMSGASLRNLMDIGDQLSLSSRPIRVDLDALARIKTPAVLHWDLDHFVVLKSISARSAVIHDPAIGRVVMTISEVSNHFTGIALELNPVSNFEPLQAKSAIKLSSLWSNIHGAGSAVAQIVLLSLSLQIVAFAMPFQMQLVIDEAIGRNDKDLLTVIALGFGALALLQGLIDAIRSWTLQLFGQQMIYQMVGNIVRHLLRLSCSYFEKRHVGDILSRIKSTQAVQDILTKGLISAMIDGTMALVAVIILVTYSPVLAFCVIGSLFILVGLNAAFYPIMRQTTEEQLATSAKEQTHLMETVRAAATIKVMGREAERETIWRNLYGKTINATVTLGRYQVSLSFLQTVVMGLQLTLVVYFGARMVLDAQGFSVGMLMAFLSFRQTFGDRVTSLVEQALQFRLLGLHLERLGDIVLAEPDVKNSVLPPIEVKGDIQARDLSFRYGPSDPILFKDLSLHIKSGEFVAIVGASGGGKTTLLKLLLGLNQPSNGDILLDGNKGTPELWRSWRSHVGVVTQDDRLLSGSIAENISFFDPNMDMKRVVEAAAAAQLHEDTMRKPMQYQSLIGDMGASLSGGQRQRVLLARALYNKPKMLILDEGTANLDEDTETAIATMIRTLQITRIVVAHRPTLVRMADRVLQMEDGRLIDRGAKLEAMTQNRQGSEKVSFA